MEVPSGCAIVVYTRMEGSTLKTKVRKKYGRRCSIRRYDMTPLSESSFSPAPSERAYAFADGELSHVLGKAARSGSFTAIIAKPKSARSQIIDIVDHEDAVAHIRRERMLREDAEWEAMAPKS